MRHQHLPHLSVIADAVDSAHTLPREELELVLECWLWHARCCVCAVGPVARSPEDDVPSLDFS